MYTPQILCVTFCILFAMNEIVAPSTTPLGKQRVISKSGARRVHETPIDTVEIGSSESKAAADTHSSSSHSISSSATEPKAGTSRIGAKERELLLEEHKRLSFLASSINLDAALESTYGENLDPARDGLYGHVQRIILTHGSAVAAGAAIGYGAQEYLSNGTTAVTNATIESGRSMEDAETLELGK